MKIKVLSILIFACFIGIAQAEYISKELYVLPWGWDNDQEIPMAKDDIGGVLGPYKQFVDLMENVYFAFPFKDFRKYNSAGKIDFRLEIYVYSFAVDSSENVYFNTLDADHLNVLKVIDSRGKLSEKQMSYLADGNQQNILWMKNENGQIKVGNQESTALITATGLQSTGRELRIPKDSKNFYYNSETSRRKTLNARSKSESFNNNYINLLKYKLDNETIAEVDTIRLDICRYNHTCGELLNIDAHDNFYFEISYSDSLPVDIVILDSSLKVIDKISLIPRSQTVGINAKPFILPDGTIYEFRDLQDGLHVIRWTRKE